MTVWMPFVPSKATLAVPHLCVMTPLLAHCAITSLRLFQELKLDGSAIPQHFPLPSPLFKRQALCLILSIILLPQ